MLTRFAWFGMNSSLSVFWRKVKNIIRQNKAIEPEKDFEAKIENLQNQVNSLHQTLNLKHALSELSKRSQATKIDQQGDSVLKSEQSPQSANLLPNDSEVRNPTYQPKGMES